MRKLFLFLVAASLFLTACENYGDKVEINDKSEVYYKGEGVTEADAKKLGDFLLAQNFFNTTNERAVQLRKDSNAYVVRIVVDKEKITGNKEEIITSFKVWQMWIAEEVFPTTKTKLVLTDGKFNDMVPVGEFTPQERRALFGDEGTTTDSATIAPETTPQQ